MNECQSQAAARKEREDELAAAFSAPRTSTQPGDVGFTEE